MLLCKTSKIDLLLGNHQTYRKINHATGFPVVGFGGVGVVTMLIALFPRKREPHQAVIEVGYLIRLKIAQKVKIKIGAVSYLFQHPSIYRFQSKNHHVHEIPTGPTFPYGCPRTISWLLLFIGIWGQTNLCSVPCGCV